MMSFYGYFRSSAAYRCRIAFNLKGLVSGTDYEFTSVHLRRNGGEQKTEAYRALNPQALVPSLKVDGQVITQSLAIMEWLDETYPEPAIVPTEKNLRAQVRAFSQVIACDIHPLQNLRILQYLKHDLGQDQAAADAWCQRWLGDGLMACEQLLAKRVKPSAFCFGDSPTIADICLVPQVFSAERFSVDISAMPLVKEVYKNCNSLNTFADAQPAKQADAE